MIANFDTTPPTWKVGPVYPDECAITRGDISVISDRDLTHLKPSPSYHHQSYLTVSFIKLSHLIYARDRYFFRRRSRQLFLLRNCIILYVRGW